MGSIKEKNRNKRQRTRMRRHKASILSICGVILLLAIILSVGSISLLSKNRRYQQIEEFEEYAGTDSYIEDVAKDKLGLIYENEILFEPES